MEASTRGLSSAADRTDHGCITIPITESTLACAAHVEPLGDGHVELAVDAHASTTWPFWLTTDEARHLAEALTWAATVDPDAVYPSIADDDEGWRCDGE